MAFIIRIPGYPPLEDWDFTLDDLDAIERESGVPWVLATPFRSAKVAKAYFRVAYRHHGLDPDDVDKLTQRDFKGWLDVVPNEDDADDDADAEDGEADPPTTPRRARRSRPSSGASPTATSGPRQSAASNG